MQALASIPLILLLPRPFSVTDHCYGRSLMTIATNVVRRKGSLNFYVRVTVPNELRASLGKREIWKSLGTSSRKEALGLSHAVLADIHKLFAGGEPSKEPTAADLKAAVRSFEWRELEYDLDQRSSWLTESQFNEEHKLIYKGQPDGEARAEVSTFVVLIHY